MGRPSLEDELPAPRPTGFEVDEGPGLFGPHVLGDEAVAARQHVLFRPVEQEDQVVLQGRRAWDGQHLQNLQHDGAADCVVAGSGTLWTP